MKLYKHIARRFLTDDDMAHEISEAMYPDFYKSAHIDYKRIEDHPQSSGALSLYDLVRSDTGKGILPNKNYVISETVTDKLELLKVNKNSEYKLTGKKMEDIDTTIMTYDWSVFNNIGLRKVTFILQDNCLLRMQRDENFLALFFLKCDILDWENNQGHIHWTVSFIDWRNKRVSSNFIDPEMQAIELYIYRLLCFIYLSENDEVLVPPGGKHGTRKSGKIINELKLPVTVVTSKWNITSIRTEGFDVSGHFRLQPVREGHKMIWIDPFRKHGYVRKAKSETEK